MDLLVVSTWFPYPTDNGSRLRAFHLLRELAKRHRVRLVAGLQEDVAGGESEGRRRLEGFCKEVVTFPWRWYDPGARGWRGAARSLGTLTPRSVTETDSPSLRAAVADGLAKRPDAVLVLELGMAPFVPENAPPAVVDQVEVSGWERAGGARAMLTTGKARRYWRRTLRNFDAVTAVSEEEAAAVRRVLGGGNPTPPVAVVPNGVDVHAYARPAGRAVPGRLLYNGSLSYGPNLDAVRYFAQEVLPLVVEQVAEAHLVVTGRVPEDLAIGDLRANPRIHLTGFLPDLRPALDEAALCVVPLRAGGGTRLKVLEAWAAGLPVVSTTIGAAGLGATDGEHLALADTPRAMADAVARLLREPEQAARLACRARQLAEERYDWSAIGAGLSELLEDVVQGKGGA